MSVGEIKYWTSITMSADGTKLAASVYNGNIWTSRDCPAAHRHAPGLCAPWSNCSVGQIITQNGTTTTDRQCADCVGSYNNALNQNSCKVWTECLAGQEITHNGTTTTDRQCAACVIEAFTSAIV
jgi:hypothetical protein